MIQTNNISFLKSTSTRRLLPSEIVFAHVSFENREQAVFYMEPVFPVDEIFGLAYIPDEKIRVSALYDLHRHSPLNILDFVVEAEGKEYHYEYMLTKAECRLLEDKMESFFFKRTGIRLADFTLESWDRV